ncbi:hypothetical protein FZEAL_6451 [Fusarium zealandicum]|uniref:NmrA-like domain-containing protein n=1 Tax=Fusarium zealandicum TaxID=1053134 RepID=A0A8H4UIU8_9HYPO|nr:hypothetical protein FZEAL_6451 [Fusarium zealandicum]
MSTIEYYLVAGATGRQGGATVDALLNHPDFKIDQNKVYALSRQATGPGAVKLRQKYNDINILSGDLNDPSGIFQQLDKSILGKTAVTVTKDIGRWAVEGLVRPDRTGIRNQAVSIASDELSFKDIDDIFLKHTGKGVPVTYGFLARFVIWMVKDLNTMFGFIGERPYGADLAWLRAQLEPTTFQKWVKNEVPE